jgi:hypothetical protein
MRHFSSMFAATLTGACFLLGIANAQDARTKTLKLKNYEPVKKSTLSKDTVKAAVTSPAASGSTLPVWNYQVISSRDGNLYDGVIVGQNPNDKNNPSATVPGQLIPVLLKTHLVGTAVDTNGILTTTAGDTTFDPTQADACLAAPNNLPVKLMRQSPVLADADFNFGGTDVGTTQYVDAFQRANFWRAIDKQNYHVRLKPIILAPLVIDVPVGSGLAVAPGVLANSCAPFGIVDINFLDAFVSNAFTQLAKEGVNPKTFPMFMLYNSAMSFGDPTNLGNCCAGGYHSINPANALTFQTYSPFDFDTTGIFGTGSMDTGIASHEVAEWVNDPYVINPTPAWGNTGQVIGCQNNYEVGDPLTGSEAPRIVMQNGYTYHLQELAFFSWFYGAPSLGLHGWYSNNGTFLTDAGPVCQ